MATVPRKGIQGFGIGFNKPEITQFKISQTSAITERHKSTTDTGTIAFTLCLFMKTEDHLISENISSHYFTYQHHQMR